MTSTSLEREERSRRTSSGTPCRTLAEYVVELVERLDESDPPAGRRLREITGARAARITLDQETVDVYFAAGSLHATSPDPAREPDGRGTSDRQTTLDLLAARLEVTDAILAGRIDLIGDTDDVDRIFQAIEILLDAAPRAPRLQQLSRDYQVDPCRAVERRAFQAVPFGPTERLGAEQMLLEKLDLLP